MGTFLRTAIHAGLSRKSYWRLEHDPVAQTFSHEPTFYFQGGPAFRAPATVSSFGVCSLTNSGLPNTDKIVRCLKESIRILPFQAR